MGIGSAERPLQCVSSGHKHLLFCFFNSLKWKRQAKELVGAWVTWQSAPDSGKMGPWHAVLEVPVSLDLQNVGLPFWHINKPTIYKENPPNNIRTLAPVPISNSAVYVYSERVEFPFCTPFQIFYKLNLDGILTPWSIKVRRNPLNSELHLVVFFPGIPNKAGHFK